MQENETKLHSSSSVFMIPSLAQLQHMLRLQKSWESIRKLCVRGFCVDKYVFACIVALMPRENSTLAQV